jgi:terminase large subunit-like protein
MLRIPLDYLQTRAARLLVPGTRGVFVWGRGSGKTYWERAMVHRAAFGSPGSHIGILYPTLKQARQVIWSPHLWTDYDGELHPWVKHKDRSLLEVTLRNGSRVSTWGAENSAGIRGQRFTHIFQDESDDIEPEVEDAVVSPTLSKSGSQAIWAKTGTPRRGRHGVLWRDFTRVIKGVPGFVGFKVKSSESPQVDQAWLAQQRDLIPPAVFAREYEGDFDSGEGLVYPFDEAFHVAKAPVLSTFHSFVVGMDHGWVDAGVMLLIGIQGHGRDATAWVLDEWYETECPNQTWNERALKWQFAKFFADPSRPDRISELRGIGINCGETDNNIQGGIARVADMLFRRKHESGEAFDFARLYVDPQCTNTIREFGLYRRKKHPDGTFDDEPEDKNNHAMDALRYAIVGRFGRGENRRHETSGR